MKNKNWILFYVFVYFISSGHSFWPLKKRPEDTSKVLTNPRSDNNKKENKLLKELKDQKEEDIIISKDTVWSGKIEIKQVVLVKKGVRLTIKPGTELIFSGPRAETDDVHDIRGGGIKVEGQIYAAGTSDKPIVFTGKVKNPGGWGNIYLSYSQDNIFTYCIFEYANYAIHSHFSSLNISHSLFENNNEGCRLGYSQALIENSIFRLNESRGINFRAGKNNINNNSIVANRVGIFVYEKGNQSVISFNNIFNNAEYNLQLGDFHKEDINISNNFWGTGVNYDKIIFDKKDDESIGKAELFPVINEEFHWKDENKVKTLKLLE